MRDGVNTKSIFFRKTWRELFSSHPSKPSQSIPKGRTPRAFHLELEQLEERLLLSTTAFSEATQTSIIPAAATQSAQTVYTPSQIASYYGFNRILYPTLSGIAPGNGAGQTIAIVDKGYDPWLAFDLTVFDNAYGIPPPPLLTQIGENGGPPDTSNWDPSGMWTAEISLDVEWAHALAPGANIVVVGAEALTTSDLFTAVNTAASIPGVSVVSMSWGSNGDVSPAPPSLINPSGIDLDLVFAAHPNVTFVASSGDTAGQLSYPSTSPYVLAVGSTVLQNGREIGWTDENGPKPGQLDGSGGGWTLFEAEPSWQYGVQQAGTRSTPDVSAIGGSLLSVYDSYPLQNGTPSGWISVYGTSAAAPQWAALIAVANQGRAINHLGQIGEQAARLLYSLPPSDFNTVDGSNSYSPITGLGSPIAYKIVQGLGAPLSDPPPLPPNNPAYQQQLLWSIPSQQFAALAYDWLAQIDPGGFETAAQVARLALDDNPMLYTTEGRIIDALVVYLLVSTEFDHAPK